MKTKSWSGTAAEFAAFIVEQKQQKHTRALCRAYGLKYSVIIPFVAKNK